MFVEICVSCGLFKGKTLTEELAFVRYFHNKPENVWLHIIGFHCLMTSVLVLLKYFNTSIEIIVLLLYAIMLLLLDLITGIIGCTFLICCYYIVEYLSSYSIIPTVLLFGSIGGALQIFGHVFYDKSQPAFRFFEAFFTTPFYLYLYILTSCGMHLDWYEDIKNKTMMWKGSERVVYGDRIIN